MWLPSSLSHANNPNAHVRMCSKGDNHRDVTKIKYWNQTEKYYY